MTHEVEVRFTDTQSEVFDAEGWAIGDPVGFVKVILPETVKFYPIEVVHSVTVPLIRPEDES